MSSCRKLSVLVAFTALLGLSPRLWADDLDLNPDSTPSTLTWSGDLLLRQDWLRSWSGGDNETRLLLRLRYGPTWQIDDQWTLAAALRINESTIGNEYMVGFNDNQRPRDLALDTLYMTYAPAEGQLTEAGKDVFPLNLSRMLWDPDLRPAGVSYSYKQPIGDASLRLVAGAFLGQHVSGDQSRIGALQADLRLDEPGAVHPEFILSYLHYTDLDGLLIAGEDRGNPFVGTEPTYYPTPPVAVDTTGLAFIDKFELADLQFVLHVDGDVPFRMLLDADKNLGAVDGNDRAGRMELVLGDSFHAGGNEVGYAAERMQHSSVLGAFNDDDWWFHAGSHGSMYWYAYGWSDRVRFRAAWFHEQPDGSWHHWNRLLLDLTWQL